MRLSIYTSLLVLLFLGHATALAEPLPDTYGNRLAVAQRYLKTTDPEKMMEDMAKEMAKNLPSDQRRSFVKSILKALNMEQLKAAMLAVMARHYTVEELQALADFYDSKLGQSIMKKAPVVMGEMYPLMQQELMRASQAAK